MIILTSIQSNLWLVYILYIMKKPQSEKYMFSSRKKNPDIPDNSTTQNFIVENYTLIYYFDYKIIFLIKKSIIKYIFSYKSHVKIIKHSHSSLCALKYI